jgi:flagellar motor switch protein FliN/FliY
VADKDDLLSPDEIEALFESARGSKTPAPITPGPSAPPPAVPAPPAGAEPRRAGESPAPLLQADDISELIRQHAASQRSRVKEPPPSSSSPRPTEALLNEMEANLAAAVGQELPRTGPAAPEAGGALPFTLSEFEGPVGAAAGRMGMQAIEDVELDVRIELGRAELLIEDVLKLREGSVVPLDKLAGDPVDILVNGRLIARGEVLVLNDNFCVRVAEILDADP